MAVGDIGIWYDAAGTKTWTTSFTTFPFNTEERNDGIYVISVHPVPRMISEAKASAPKAGSYQDNRMTAEIVLMLIMEWRR